MSGAVESGGLRVDNAAVPKEVDMGRPRELTEEERAELLAKGYTPIEMWVPDLSNAAVRRRLAAELKAIRESDARSGELDRLSETVEDLADDFER